MRCDVWIIAAAIAACWAIGSMATAQQSNTPAFGTRFGTHHHTHALRPFVGCGRGSCLWTQADARKLSQVFRRQLPFLALGREFNECPM